MSLRELRNWERFYATEPFLPERVDIAGALIASTIANVNRGKNSKPFSLEDFMLVANALRKLDRQEANDNAEDLHFMRTMAELGGFSR